MIADQHAAEDLCARADVDVAADRRHVLADARPDRHLLEDQTVRAEDHGRMNDDPVRMREHQTAADLHFERDLRAGDDRPEAMLSDGGFAAELGDLSWSRDPSLIFADRSEQSLRRVPFTREDAFSRPVGLAR